jgi:hypothetical protein
MSEDEINQKLDRAKLPFDLCTSGVAPIAYYPPAHLLVVRAGLADDVYFSINRQNLVRFFSDRGDLDSWLRRNRYEGISGPEPPTMKEVMDGVMGKVPRQRPVLRLVEP